MSQPISRINRRIAKAQLWATTGTCQWPGCTAPAVDMHEIIKRALTESNPEARDLTFVPELCAALCYTHHQTAHNAQDAMETLLKVNIHRYGREAVQRAVDAVQQALHSHLTIELLGETNEQENRD